MEKPTRDAERIMLERFGKDSLIALATVADGIPHVRTVDAFYEDGSFYVLTHALSNKMKQIGINPVVAVAGEWFTGHGEGINLGYFGSDANKPVAERMKKLFSAWIDNGHNDFSDENTCILRVRLNDGVLFADGARYEIDFTE